MTWEAPQIAPLTDNDIPPCTELMISSEPWIRYGVTAESATALWSRALHERAEVCVARLRTRTVGFAWYVRNAGFGLSGYLKLLGVDPETRGQGVGAALLQHTERQTLADNQTDLLLLVSDFNLDAQRFYRRQGYQQVGALMDYVVPGIAELIFHKRLHQHIGA
jgi:ribosomal protein S18 acetylase RimI-like enzyme